MRIVGRRLVVPRHPAGIDLYGNQRAREQVVALAADARITRSRVAGAEDVELRFGIVRARHPDLTAAVARRVETWPRLQARIARIHRHGIKLPLQLARLGIERLQKSRSVEVVAGADEHVIADDNRRERREILLLEIGDFDVPALLAGARIERDQIVVGRLEVEVVVPHADAAAADMRAAARFPEVVPDLMAVARVDGPRVVRR